MRKKKVKQPAYLHNQEEFKAYNWCINNGIYISPFCKENYATWYIDIEINKIDVPIQQEALEKSLINITEIATNHIDS